jgi:predicted NAD-dependent protein-ADP-ribosyltransferase YbiA (DUF1768 family)
MFAKALQTLERVCHCQLLGRKCCVNRFKIIYFYAINQFWGLPDISSNSESNLEVEGILPS